MTHRLRTEIDIDAEPATVWEVLRDLASYPEWNPFITSAKGDLAVGEHLTLRLEPPGGKVRTFRPTLTRVDDGRTIEWLGRLVVPGLFDGRHRLYVVPIGPGTRLVHGEHFSGVLVPLLKRTLEASFRAGFEAMNAAVKARSEASRDVELR